jgi:hypothetical protein
MRRTKPKGVCNHAVQELSSKLGTKEEEQNEKKGKDFTEDILWSDCPEELYLQRILEEQQRNAGTTNESLLGASTVEHIFVQKTHGGTVRTCVDWEPIAGSVVTEDAVEGADKVATLESRGTTRASQFDSKATSRSETEESYQIPIQPRFINFGEHSSTASLPDEHLEEIVEIDEENAGLSTLSGDSGLRQIQQPQVDPTRWWFHSEDITYVKPEGTPTTLGISGTDPQTRSTQNSNTLEQNETKDAGRCCDFIHRATEDDKVFRRVVAVAVVLLFLFVSLSASALIKSRRIGEVTPSQIEDGWPSQLSLSPDTEPPTSQDIQTATEAPSFVVEPEPYQTLTPTLSKSPLTLSPSPSPIEATFPNRAPSPIVGKPETTAPTTFPAKTSTGDSLNDSIADLLLEKSPASLESLGEQSSPQFQALQWVGSDLGQHTFSNDRIIQRWVLAVLFYSTNGDAWQNADGWLTSLDECSWFTTSGGGICDDQGRITHVELRDNKLEGTLPRELSLLSNSLGKSSNPTMDPLSRWAPAIRSPPADIALVHIYFNSNSKIRGILPSSFGVLTNLGRCTKEEYDGFDLYIC